MYTAFPVGEYIFDGDALQTAYNKLAQVTTGAEDEYSAAALRALLEFFGDWGPERADSVTATATQGLDGLSDAEKRDLFEQCCTELSSQLQEEYDHDVGAGDIRRLAAFLADPEASPAVAEYLLEYLWIFAEQLNQYDPESDSGTDIQHFLDGIGNLPTAYLIAEQEYYGESQKVNHVRHELLSRLQGDTVSVEELNDIKQRERSNFDQDVFRAWRDFTILGQIHFDYFVPRINAYLDHLAEYFQQEVGLEDHQFHTVDFADPRNYLSDFTWLAIYPGEEDHGQSDEYQLYVGIYADRVSYGLHVGQNLRDEDEWKRNRDLDQFKDRNQLSIDLVVEKLRGVTDEYRRLNDLEVEIETPDKPTQADEIERQLDAKKQVVFYGPPGTGKTYIAKKFADWWVHENTDGTPRDDQVQAVTFHPSFSYEDFLEGLSADATESGAVEYEIEDGVLKRVAETAADAYRNADSPESAPPYVLIIDEINRGNLSQIFGETITLLESDKRESFTTQLAHSDESFSLPPNLYLVGTMNTADRSIALVDAALRRRFRFLPFPPNTDVLADHHGLDPTALPNEVRGADNRFESLLALSIRAIETINNNITDAPDLSKGQQIGHSYLFGVETIDEIVDAWRFDIVPLIEEYYFGQFDQIRRHLFDGAGDAIVNWDDERIRQFDDAALASFLLELTDLDTDYEAKSVDSSLSPSDSQTASPTYPEFLSTLNEEIYQEVGDTLNVGSPEEMHHNPDFDRLTLGLKSAHPDHPDTDQIRYVFQPRVHLDDPVIQVGVHVLDEEMHDVIASLRDVIPEQFEYYENHKYSAIKAQWSESVAKPHDLDGEEFTEALDDETFNEAKQALVTLIETLHPEFVSAKTP